MNKKILMFLFGVVLLVAAVASVDAALCRGFDGYYHDCGYTYGHNSYGKGHTGYHHGQKVISLGGLKKYNPINDYYIYSGPGYDRTRKDVHYKYVSYNDRDYRKYHNYNSHKVRYIKDERHYEHRPYADPDAKKFKIYIVGAEDRYHRYDDTVIRLGRSSWDDGDPYHAVKVHKKVKKWHFEGEEHCPDGFVCVSGDYH